MGYIITNGIYYIETTSGKPCLNSNINMATNYDTQMKAKNIIQNIPKSLAKYKWKVVEMSKDITDTPNYIDVDYEKSLEIVKEFSELLRNIKSNKYPLLQQLSDVDKKISDVLHYIEFTKFSASDGYKLVRMLQQFRQERRKIKNELDLFDICQDTSIREVMEGSLYNKFVAVGNKKYSPRILMNLFNKEESVGGK